MSIVLSDDHLLRRLSAASHWADGGNNFLRQRRRLQQTYVIRRAQEGKVGQIVAAAINSHFPDLDTGTSSSRSRSCRPVSSQTSQKNTICLGIDDRVRIGSCKRRSTHSDPTNDRRASSYVRPYATRSSCDTEKKGASLFLSHNGSAAASSKLTVGRTDRRGRIARVPPDPFIAYRPRSRTASDGRRRLA